jgi:hypothetical protein
MGRVEHPKRDGIDKIDQRRREDEREEKIIGVGNDEFRYRFSPSFSGRGSRNLFGEIPSLQAEGSYKGLCDTHLTVLKYAYRPTTA